MAFRPPFMFNTALAEELRRKEQERTRGKLEEIAATIDDILEEFGLGHPAQAIVELLEDISPYSILTRKLGIPSPGDIIDYIRYNVSAVWKQLPPLLPPPPGAPEIRKLVE